MLVLYVYDKRKETYKLYIVKKLLLLKMLFIITTSEIYVLILHNKIYNLF